MERGLCHNKLKVTHKDSNVFEAFVRVLKAGQAKYKESDGFDEDHIPFLNVIMPLRRGRDVDVANAKSPEGPIAGSA